MMLFSAVISIPTYNTAIIIIIICLFSNLVACTKLQKRPENVKKAAIYTAVSTNKLRVLKRDEPISTQKSVRIGVLVPSCARAQVISMIDAYSLGKQAGRS